MLTRVLFTLTLFAAAFLSFSIQPILGKMLLPIVGGAPAGWIVAMAFFQLALLGGYALSHLLQRVSPFTHGVMLLLVYAAGLCVLPVQIDGSLATASSLSLAVFGLLTRTVLLPFVALTATTSALLRVFSHTDQLTAQDPYYLFTASNAGSLIGLFIYPLALEPFFALSDLARVWSVFYAVLTLCVLGCVWITRRSARTTVHHLAATATVAETTSAIPLKTIAAWFWLACVPCSLSMSMTTWISTDMGSLPLVWTLPLGLYLLSFIFGFARHARVSLRRLHTLHLAAAVGLFVYMLTHLRSYALNFTDFALNIALVLALFFVICWSCHRTLAARRPAARHLTFYYLVIALGGAAAGVLNAFVAPFVLNMLVEFPLSLIACVCIPALWSHPGKPGRAAYQAGVAAAVVVLAGCILYACFRTQAVDSDLIRQLKTILTVIFIVLTFGLILYPRALIVLFSLITVYMCFSASSGQVLARERNFFGAVTVSERAVAGVRMRTLRHGNTTHGVALYDLSGQPTYDLNAGYYLPTGPLKNIIDLVQPRRVAVMGLGTGQLACFPSWAQTTYFEIDPDIVRIARQHFPYLAKCPPHDIVLGDARLTFSHQKHAYDLLILDVFSSDGIPTHIMTQNAIAMYLQHINLHGLMLFHVSNRYLALAPQIAASAATLGLNAYTVFHTPDPRQVRFGLATQWVAIPLDHGYDARLEQAGWTRVQAGQTSVWTDERSSVLSVLRPVAHWLARTEAKAP